MKCFFYSNLLEAVMTLDSDNRPGVQVVRDKFCWTGPNDWESENNNINVWPAFWGGYFEWCWMYHPSSQGGTLLLSAVENAKRPQAVALVLPGVNLVGELELMKTCGIRDTPAEKPLILYLSPMFEPRQQGGIKDGQHRTSMEAMKKLGKEITTFLNETATDFGLAFLTRNESFKLPRA